MILNRHLDRVGRQMQDDAIDGKGGDLILHCVDGHGYRADITLRVQAEYVAKGVALWQHDLPRCVGLGLIGAVAA